MPTLTTKTDKLFTVYEHISPSGKRYIGITCQENPEYRWGNSGKGYKQSHFLNAINKYGWENFYHNILYTKLTQEEACRIEDELIQKYNTMDPKYGYNHCSGGIYSKMSEQTKKRISESSKGRTFTEEQKYKMGATNRGKKLSKEIKDKISRTSKKLYKNNSELRYKVGSGMRGKHLSEEQLKKRSECFKGRIYVHKNNIVRFVKPEIAEKLLQEGYLFGKGNSKIYVCNKNNETKYINPSDLDSYLQQGWRKGRKFKEVVDELSTRKDVI